MLKVGFMFVLQSIENSRDTHSYVKYTNQA